MQKFWGWLGLNLGKHWVWVVNVVSPLTALQFNDNLIVSPTDSPADSIAGKILLEDTARDPSPEGQTKRGEDTAKTLERLTAIPEDERTLDNPAYVDFLLHDNQGDIRAPLLANFPDDRHAQVITRLDGNASIEEEGNAAVAVTAVADKLEFADATTITTGAPVLLKNINDYLTGGILILGAISVAIMALILLLLFNVRWRLLPLFIVVVGVIWAFGIIGYLGLPLTIVTIAELPVMLGIGIDYAIQMHARVEEEVVIGRADHPIQETARNLGPALRSDSQSAASPSSP